MGGFLRQLDSTGVSQALKLLCRFQVLTAVRPSEARESVWREIHISERIWTIPGSRMKTGEEHRVPLSGAAIEVLEQARLLGERSGLVFPSPLKSNQPLSNMALTQRFRKMGYGGRVVPHGFRSSFRDWCMENGIHDHAAESSLAHVVPGVTGSYLRSDVFEMRKAAMDQWADYLKSTS